MTVEPDLVTFCLLFTTLEQNHHYPTVAHIYLARAIRLAKKQAGSKCRRSMARRRRVNNNNKENEHNENANNSSSPLPFMAAVPQIQTLLPGFHVLYELDDLVIVNKPAGVNCFHKQTTNAGKIKSNKKNADISLQDALLHGLVTTTTTTSSCLSTLNPDCLASVHQSDRGTSGCLVLAKNNAMHARLVTLFFTRQIHKQYTAVTTVVVENF
jgi:23S rRNA-/tRNA-specific pseudouridylate synthase